MALRDESKAMPISVAWQRLEPYSPQHLSKKMDVKIV
jgi:hypothetical protein